MLGGFMRITEEELTYLDLTWFAVDKFGRIIELTSNGSGNVPEFVCKSQEKVNILEDYFVNKASDNYINFSEKRLYYFDAYDGKNRTTNYIKKSSPSNPLLISQIPKCISEILSNNRLDIDVEAIDRINVEHAYRTKISLEHLVTPIIKGQFPLNLRSRYFSIDFKTKLKFKKIMSIFKKDSNTSFKKIKSIVETADQTEITKEYYEIRTSQNKFILYFVYKRDVIIYDKADWYSLQISKKNGTELNFNDKAGVLIKF